MRSYTFVLKINLHSRSSVNGPEKKHETKNHLLVVKQLYPFCVSLMRNYQLPLRLLSGGLLCLKKKKKKKERKEGGEREKRYEAFCIRPGGSPHSRVRVHV